LPAYRDRRIKVIEKAGVDALVIGYPANMRYLVGVGLETYERPCLLLANRDHAILLAPELEAERARKASVSDLILYEDGDDPYRMVAEALEDMVPRKGVVGFDGWMPLKHYIRIVEDLDVRTALVDEALYSVREVKDEEEIRILRRSADLLQEIFERIPGLLEKGISEADLAFELARIAARRGAEDAHALVQFAENSAIPHHTYSARTLRQGELVLVDMVLSLNGYYSDITRMFSLGEPPREAVKIAGIVGEANRAARLKALPGVKAGIIDEAARHVIDVAGYGDYFTHRTGHGLGLEVHERPFIAPGSSMVLSKGMVFTVEPGIYLPGRFGVRIEDDVVVMENGVEVLTGRLPRKIIAV